MSSAMSRGLRHLTPVVVMVLASACGGGDGGAGGTDEVAQGQKLFRTTCATCHGRDGEGISQLGKDLRGNEFVQDRSVEELVAFFIEGRPAFHPDNERKVEMPPRGGNPTLSDEDLRLISAYVKSLQ